MARFAISEQVEAVPLFETSAIPQSTSGNFPARASADPSAAVSPA